ADAPVTTTRWTRLPRTGPLDERELMSSWSSIDRAPRRNASRDPEGALRPARLVETRAVFARMSLSPHVFDPTGAFDESRAVDPSRMTPTDTLRRPPTVMERLRN